MDISKVTSFHDLTPTEQEQLKHLGDKIPDLALERNIETGKWQWSYRCEASEEIFDSAFAAFVDFTCQSLDAIDTVLEIAAQDEDDRYDEDEDDRYDEDVPDDHPGFDVSFLGI